ncbi:MAG: hypothetical protein PHP08_04125 [Candidatus Dojkabacteria bacterium]|nr:hypothetical protein [Candidatus Dojkabacteria bacterium]
MNKNTVFISVVILIGCIILGFFYYLTKTEEHKLLLELQNNEKIEENLQETTEASLRQNCYNEAIENAQDLLESKVDLMKSQNNLTYSDKQLLQSYEEAIENDMYLKEDFNSYYETCLSKNGLSK